LEQFLNDRNVNGLTSITEDFESELDVYLKLFVLLYVNFKFAGNLPLLNTRTFDFSALTLSFHFLQTSLKTFSWFSMGNISPFLFSMYLNDLEQFLNDRNVNGLTSITEDFESELDIYI
jgi:hypothetical protein